MKREYRCQFAPVITVPAGIVSVGAEPAFRGAGRATGNCYAQGDDERERHEQATHGR